MQIATWNVNSLRVRLPQVLDWLRAAQPDVVALQEIKCLDAEVPASAFAALGYQVVSSGQKTYNGVATLARAPLRDCVVDLPTRVDPQRRLLAATIDGLRVTTGCSASRCAAAAGAVGSTSRRGATSGRRTMLRC